MSGKFTVNYGVFAGEDTAVKITTVLQGKVSNGALKFTVDPLSIPTYENSVSDDGKAALTTTDIDEIIKKIEEQDPDISWDTKKKSSLVRQKKQEALLAKLDVKAPKVSDTEGLKLYLGYTDEQGRKFDKIYSNKSRVRVGRNPSQKGSGIAEAVENIMSMIFFSLFIFLTIVLYCANVLFTNTQAYQFAKTVVERMEVYYITVFLAVVAPPVGFIIGVIMRLAMGKAAGPLLVTGNNNSAASIANAVTALPSLMKR